MENLSIIASQLEKMIKYTQYDKADVTKKMDTFMVWGRITIDEYNYLMGLMG